MRHRLEYAPVWLLMQVLRLLPRPLARAVTATVAIAVYAVHTRLRHVGIRNLRLAFPDMSADERERTLRGTYFSLARLLAEIPKFKSYTRANIAQYVGYDGLENYTAAQAAGHGVLFLTAHLGGWEVGSYAHAVNGYPLHVVMRPLDNPYLDRMARELRSAHGNRVIDKNEFARGVLAALRRGETVGVLMDTNMTAGEGVFVPFFGTLASTTTSVARLALRTGAAVVPAFTVWDTKLEKYVIRFEPAIPAVRTGNDTEDAIATTVAYNRALEAAIRRYPGQWLWVHRRWKTRPPGEPSLY